jgi:GNAT superfamily N-acetyltransferase
MQFPTQHYITTRSGRALWLRRSRLNDVAHLDDLAQHLSAKSRWLRWMAPITAEGVAARWQQDVQAAANDGAAHMMLVATTVEHTTIVAVAQAVALRETPTVAEVALVVRDDYQRDGVGSVLWTSIGSIASTHNFHQFQATMLAENIGMRQFLRHLEISYAVSQYGPEIQITIDLPEQTKSGHTGHI